MQNIKHNEMVRRLVKPGGEILKNMTSEKSHLLRQAIDIFAEAGDVVESTFFENLQGELKDSGLASEEQSFWMDLVHAGVGIAGEAGELLDAVKKMVVYNKPLDRDNVIEELGDLEFYCEQWEQNPMGEDHWSLHSLREFMANVREAIGVTREETLEANIAKLRVRYEGLIYSDSSAQERADKQG